ncbi:hypothetical protein BYT27DRAFT_7296411 [Phlegmacium glaucopus]|nr:hypothetical protein BYT27DRAFT_7296411 [Phlegmacium glaucopus]
MSTSTAKMGDNLLRIPKLDISGSNWVIYKDHFTWSIDARGLLEHLEELAGEPICPVADPEGKLTDDEKVLVKEWKKEVKEWKQGEAIVKQQIASLIPDSLFMKVRSKQKAYKIWKEISNNFQNKS